MSRRARIRVQMARAGPGRIWVGDSSMSDHNEVVKITGADRPVLVTRRLRLEPLAEHHAEGVWRAVEASLSELKQWMGWAGSASREAQTKFVRDAESGWGRDGWIFAIVHRDEVIGTIGIDRYQPLIESAEVGYWLRSDSAGRGFMSEAAGAVVEWAFTTLGLHRLELHAGLDNTASIRIAERLGFSRRGLLRHGAVNAWRHYDVEVFDLLATDERPDSSSAQPQEDA